jgi:O-antigen/teichoic acid export membrane protein
MTILATHDTESRERSLPEPPAQAGSLTAAALWLALGKLVAFALSFAVPLLLVRRLSQTEFGLYKQVFLIISTAVAILPLGFAGSAFYFFPRQPTRKAQALANILLFHTAVAGLACLILVLYPESLAMIFNATELVDYAPLIAPVVFFWVVSSFLETVAIANGDVRLITAYIVIVQATKALLLLGAVLLFGSLRALIGAALMIGVLQTVTALLYPGWRFPRFWGTPDWRLMRAQCAYMLPLGCAGLIYTLQGDLPHYFVANRFGAAEYAIYAIGCFQVPFVGILGEAFASVMIPRVSSLRNDNQRRQIVTLIAHMVRNLAAVYLPLFLFMLVTAREFIVVLFTTQYLASWPIFLINLTLLPLGIVVIACDPVFRAYPEHLYFLLRARIVIIGALAVGLWLGTQHLGLHGAAAAVVGVSLIERVVVAAKAGAILGVSRRDLALLKDTGKLVMAAVTAGFAAAMARWLVSDADPVHILAVCGVVLMVVYVASGLLLGALTPGELARIRLGRAAFLGRLRRAAD